MLVFTPRSMEAKVHRVLWRLQGVAWVVVYRNPGSPTQPEQCQLLPTRLTGGRLGLFMLGFCLRFNLKQRFVALKKKKKEGEKEEEKLETHLLGASEKRIQNLSL